MRITVLTPWEEHLFWIGILEDHAQFVLDHLGGEETTRAQQAEQFRTAFKALRRRLFSLDRTLPVNDPGLVQFAQEARSVAYAYYLFEGELQKNRIENTVTIQLTPAYFNGTLGENEEYLRILHSYGQGRDYQKLSLYRLLDMWLEDQLGHAVLLSDHLDPTELGYIDRSRRFIEAFQALALQETSQNRRNLNY
ncbi:DUF2935 domain-containing protein [Paenibacillus chartarius]|uniref:DUF2935 domain-containing protein n=1 Tax=Paenibacillus chartarius TaxID=747481 RepID=A0ABV6DSG5_9BACL